jgi:hypothetical protein
VLQWSGAIGHAVADYLARIAGEQKSTIVFPFPLDMASTLKPGAR